MQSAAFAVEIMDENKLHLQIKDKTTIVQKKSNQLSSPPTQIAHDLTEQKKSDINNSKTVTNVSSVKMPHPSENGVDSIDCASIPKKDNFHDFNPASIDLKFVCETTPTSESNPYQKDGHYFLKLLSSEKTRLLAMAEQAERDMYFLTSNGNIETSDEVFGILRAVSGKTKLLVSQKFKQFEGLCHSNLNPTPDEKFTTTVEDLLGFWDMVNLQIEHIDSLFKELDTIKANNWKTTKDISSPFVPTGSKLMKKPILKNGNTNITTSKASPNALLMAQKREAQRKQLLEMKRRSKSTATDNGTVSSPIQIFVNENFV